MIKSGNIIVIISFVLVIGLFFINQQINIIPDLEYNENKQKAERPVFGINSLEDYPKAFERYFSDSFCLRGTFINFMGVINTKLWRKSPKPDKVILGKKDWLYNVDKELDTYYGKRNFNKEELAQVVKEFAYRKHILDSMGIKMLVVINPTKYSIYPEYLPDILQINSVENLGDQLNKALLSNNIPVLYTKDILLDYKDESQLYYKGDNHWNDLAGFYVSEEIIRSINMGIPPIPYSSFAFDTVNNYKGNLAHMTGVAEQYSETAIMFKLKVNDAEEFNRYEHIPTENVGYKSEFQMSFKSSNRGLPNAVIIRDSFAKALIPYLKNSFYYTTFIWDGWNYAFNLEVIELEKPDVVIYMVLESIIPNIFERGLTN